MAKRSKRSRPHRRSGAISSPFLSPCRPVLLAALGLGGLMPTGAAAFPATLELSSLDGTNGFRIDGVATDDRSGRAVSAAGDVNGDGIADLLIGAYSANDNGADSGTSYVVFGRAPPGSFPASLGLSTLNGTNGFRITGVAVDDRSGSAVSAAGDVNGDGIADLLIGAPYADPNDIQQGATYVVFGRAPPASFPASLNLSTLDGTNGFRIVGVAPYDGSGFAVSSAGDVNGDGIADLVIGAPFTAPNGSNLGASYVVFGRAGPSSFPGSFQLSSLDGTNGFRIDGVAVYDRTGIAVSAGGDVNGDGIADLLIGANLADTNGYDSGASYVVFGRAPPAAFPAALSLSALDGTNGFRIDGFPAVDRVGSTGDRSGSSVSDARDVNGDGIADLLIGAPFADANGYDTGASYVVFGRAPPAGFPPSLGLARLDGTNGFRMDGAVPLDRAGSAVNGAGDVNGDGIADLLIGAGPADPNGEDSGASYVVFGRALPARFSPSFAVSALDGTNGFRIEGASPGDQSGGAASPAGDVNGDGVPDLLIGAPLANPNSIESAGASYVVFGQPPSPRPPASPDSETEPLTLSNPRPFGCEFAAGEIACAVPETTPPFILFDVEIPADARFLHFQHTFSGAGGRAPSGAGGRAPLRGVGGVFFSNIPPIPVNAADVVEAGDFQSSGQSPLPASVTGRPAILAVRNSPAPDGSGSVFRLRNIRIDRCTQKCFGQRATVCGSNDPERLTGTGRSDVIVGRGGNDAIDGRGGNDRICGGDGNDRLSGGKGNDRLDGGPGRDRLLGQDGRDLLKGGSGPDRLFGQEGEDVLRGGTGRDRCDGGSGSDRASGCERAAEVP